MRDCYGSPRQVLWKGFHKSIQYPELHPSGMFPGDLPLTSIQKKKIMDYQSVLSQTALNPEADPGAQDAIAMVAQDEDV